MCGRFTLAISKVELKRYLEEEYNIKELHSNLDLPQYNIAPGQRILCVLSDGEQFRAGDIPWGFQSPFDPARKSINIRSETASEKPSFQTSFYMRRCVVVADGFYEWSKNKNSKDPMRIQLQDEKLFGLAALWTVHVKENGMKEYSCAILTTAANNLMQDIHDRMPVILTKDQAKIWLDTSIKEKEPLQELLKPFDAGLMKLYPVSKIVNNPENNSKECIEEITRFTKEEGIL